MDIYQTEAIGCNDPTIINGTLLYHTADFLIHLGQYNLFENSIPKRVIERAKTVMPKVDIPVGVYMPMVEYLEENCGVYFKEQATARR